MADPQKMAEKMKKIAKNEDNYLLVAENTENGDLCGSLIGVVFEDIYMGMKSANEAGFFTVIMEDESSKRQREQLKAEAGIYITDFSQLLEKESLF